MGMSCVGSVEAAGLSASAEAEVRSAGRSAGLASAQGTRTGRDGPASGVDSRRAVAGRSRVGAGSSGGRRQADAGQDADSIVAETEWDLAAPGHVELDPLVLGVAQ